ncbi:MAG TPA: EAL domain-containing protein [Rhodanobacteraceae bacterium]|nr:EAL domain-containing protein [Rhodanobacteraceae bacterium]
MSFRLRLALFFVAALIAVQALTAVLVYGVTRHELIREGQRQLGVAATAFARQLDDISNRVAAGVRVLSLDYALRSAIAQRDQATLQSALVNHGERVGATQMLLLDIHGHVVVDTLHAYPVGTPFPYADLVQRAYSRPAAAVVAWRGRAYWMVVVPVFAPSLVGEIAAAIPIDDRLLERLQEQSTLPRSIELAAQTADRDWMVLAHGSDHVALTANLTAGDGTLPAQSVVLKVHGREYVAQAVPLNGTRASAPVVAVMGYSVDEALRPYRSVAAAWGGLLALGLGAGLLCALLISRSISRPVEQLAASARRIEGGDYSPPPQTRPRSDELGQLAKAFAGMTDAIREREARIVHQTGHDLVTGLPNRMAAETAIDRELGSHPDRPGALLIVGLGRAPDIVKTLGYAVCDRVMRDAGARIRAPAGDGFVAHTSDTQFAIFLSRSGRQDAIAASFRILDALAGPYRESDLALDLAPAVGIALAPLHASDANGLLRRAEIALLAAHGAEKPIAVYDPATDPHRPERLSLMGDLRAGLYRNQLALHYQPKLNLANRTIDGAEGLVRWSHPVRGLVPPDTFITLAEETGNIGKLTRWALATGIAQAKRWHASGHELRVSINVSARDLENAELPLRVAELLSLHALPSRCVGLEITEGAIMGRPDAAIAVLHALADQGIDLSIDDFGVGQSSLAYLRRLPVRELKIDRSFVEHLADAHDDQTIVRSIVELAHNLGYRVTAEGVENVAELRFLHDIGCDHAQGFHIAKAMSAADFDAFLAQHSVESAGA